MFDTRTRQPSQICIDFLDQFPNSRQRNLILGKVLGF